MIHDRVHFEKQLPFLLKHSPQYHSVRQRSQWPGNNWLRNSAIHTLWYALYKLKRKEWCTWTFGSLVGYNVVMSCGRWFEGAKLNIVAVGMSNQSASIIPNSSYPGRGHIEILRPIHNQMKKDRVQLHFVGHIKRRSGLVSIRPGRGTGNTDGSIWSSHHT